MDRGGDELVGWTIDGVAAGVLGGAIGACLLLLGYAMPGVIGGPLAGLVTLAGLRNVRPEPRRFTLRTFALEGEVVAAPEIRVESVTGNGSRLSDLLMMPAEALAEEPDVLELTDAVGSDPLELSDPLPAPAEDSRVVRLFACPPLPTPGELAQRIERHLGGGSEESRGGTVLELEVDAAAALRQALGDLRRSLA